MNFTDGTPEAMTLIEQLKSESLLVGFYDQDFHKSLKKRNRYVMDDSFKILDEKFGEDYRSHLLGIYVAPGFDHQKLVSLYPPLAPIFEDKDFPPVFIFINLAIQEVWTIKQSRKGSALIITDEGQVFDEEIFEQGAPVKDFLKLDHWGVVRRIYVALERISRAECMELNGNGSYRDYREAISWNLPTIKRCFPKSDIEKTDFSRPY